MAAPTLAAYSASAWDTTTTPKSTGSLGDAAVGDVLVALIADESDDGSEGYTVSNSGTAQAWTEQSETTGTTGSDAWAQSATAIASGALTAVTLTAARDAGTAQYYGILGARFTGSTGVGASARSTAGATGAPSLAVTTTQDNSSLIAVVVDWNAADGGSRTWLQVNGASPTEVAYFRDAARYAVYAAVWADAGAAGAKTVGLSAPTGMQWVGAVVEIKGTGATPGTSAPPVTGYAPNRWSHLARRATRIGATAARRFSTAGASVTLQWLLEPSGAGAWVGSTATITAAATPGTFTPGAATWAGSTGSATVAADPGAFTSSSTWSGSVAAIAVAGDPGTFTPGGATWAGSTGSVTATTDPGSFTPGAATWPGSTGDVTVTADPGSFSGSGGSTWTGSTGAVTIAGTSGSFTPDTATWTGSTATVTVAGTSGTWTPGAATWTGSVGSVSLTADPGSWAGSVTWDGSTGAVTVAGTSGSWAPGASTWTGTTTAITVGATSGAWTAGDAAWLGSIGVVLVAGVSGAFYTESTPDPHRMARVPAETRVLTVPAEVRVAVVPAESRAVVVPAETRTATVPAESRTLIGACP